MIRFQYSPCGGTTRNPILISKWGSQDTFSVGEIALREGSWKFGASVRKLKKKERGLFFRLNNLKQFFRNVKSPRRRPTITLIPRFIRSYQYHLFSAVQKYASTYVYGNPKMLQASQTALRKYSKSTSQKHIQIKRSTFLDFA